MTAEVILLSQNAVSEPLRKALQEFDAAVCRAIEEAAQRGVPQGLIVAVLHGQAQTAIMVERA